MGESNLVRCQNGHMFSKKRYGTVCPYCNVETATKEKKRLKRVILILRRNCFGRIPSLCVVGLYVYPGHDREKITRLFRGKILLVVADDMDIQILGDNEISRRNHAVIVFDPKKKETVLLPGDSNGLVYLNESAVYTPTPLSPYDKIELGKSVFAFLPFCGNHFMWGEKTDEE